MSKAASKKLAVAKKRKNIQQEPIVIDQAKGLVFDSEQDLYSHFIKEIETLEGNFFKQRTHQDIPESDFKSYESNLQRTLEDPDEVWNDKETLPGNDLFVYVRKFADDLFHVAVCYLTEDSPSFVYLHFPSNDAELVELYRKEELVYDRASADIRDGALEGDALSEGDELAQGLYEAMLKLRGEKDISEIEFHLYHECREDTLAEADEIWRSSDSMGNVLVSFVKEYHDQDGDSDAPPEFWYVVVTLEDAASSSHALLFSFPTTDKSLVERYRHGENLQAEEVVQEASH